jgi:RNA 2',3'-cyclic 3'-phosphodiesterase
VRLFLAIDLDDAARRAAAAWSRDLSARLGVSASREIKWVEAQNLHLTVHFFGELDDARHEEVRTALKATPLATRAFELAFAGAGKFPPSGPARVIWIGVRADKQQPQAIYDEVESRLDPLGLREETTRGFTPHLTLGRVRTPNATLGRAIREALDRTPARIATFRIDHLTLYQSRLSPKGPTYVPVDTFALGA